MYYSRKVFYYDTKNKEVGSAREFRGIQPSKYPDRFKLIGAYHRNQHYPFLKDGAIYRELYGRLVKLYDVADI